jgi:hypothetical protein
LFSGLNIKNNSYLNPSEVKNHLDFLLKPVFFKKLGNPPKSPSE